MISIQAQPGEGSQIPNRGGFKPVDVQVDKVNATFKDGVLEVRMPKSLAEKPKTKKITVK